MVLSISCILMRHIPSMIEKSIQRSPKCVVILCTLLNYGPKTCFRNWAEVSKLALETGLRVTEATDGLFFFPERQRSMAFQFYFPHRF